jgi:hypothetical protein
MRFLAISVFRPRFAGLRITRISPEPECSNQCVTGPEIHQRTVDGREYYPKNSIEGRKCHFDSTVRGKFVPPGKVLPKVGKILHTGVEPCLPTPNPNRNGGINGAIDAPAIDGIVIIQNGCGSPHFEIRRNSPPRAAIREC